MECELVSIIIPVYNRENFVKDAIDSAINQKYKNIEIIIGDNCSTDNTWAVLQEYAQKDKRIHIFQNKENIGPVRNWKKCFDNAKGFYTKILWSDDWMDENFLVDAVSLFSEDTAFVMSDYEITNGNEATLRTNFKPVYDVNEYLYGILINNRNYFPNSPGGTLFRTKDIRDNFYYEKIPNSNFLDSMKNGAGNDLLIFLNIAANYKVIRSTGRTSNFFRQHALSFSAANDIQLYYDWAKLFFFQRNPNFNYLSNNLKVQLYKKQFYNKSYRIISRSIKFEFKSLKDIINLLVFVFNRLKSDKL